MSDLEVILSENTSELSVMIQSEIFAKVATAKRHPRSLEAFNRKAISMISLSPEVALSCTYSVPRGGKSIEGPSIRFAEIIAASYQNCEYIARIVANDGKRVTAHGVFYDYENNVTSNSTVIRSILNRHGAMFTEDMITITCNAAMAIATRNAINKGIPGAITKGIHDMAKKVAKGDEKTLPTRRAAAVAWFKLKNVTEKMICDALEIKHINDIDLDQLFSLSAMKASIENGEATVHGIFEKEADGQENPDDLMAALTEVQMNMNPTDHEVCMYIMQSKDVSSYNKVRAAIHAVKKAKSK